MNILGVTHPTGADNSACLICDGTIVGLYEEERFSRQKHSLNAPARHSVSGLLRRAGITISDLDAVVVGLERPQDRLACGLAVDTYIGDMARVYDYHEARLNWLGGSRDHIDHYVAHARSVAPYFAGRTANLLMLDGWGGDSAGAGMFLSTDGQLRELWRVPISHSLGLFYQRVTAQLGFQPHADEGKTMGLAAYGEVDEALLPDYCDAETGLPELARYLEFMDRSRLKRSGDAPLTTAHRNFAATAQYYLERALIRSAERMWRETGCSAFGLAGGVALNCVANGKLANASFVSDLVVTPVANDSGVALGAAIDRAQREEGRCPELPSNHAFLGPNFGPDEIDAALRFAKLELHHCDPAIIATDALMQGKIIAVYQGHAEIGPRALGARSILADPRTRAMRDRVNSDVKRRESWRPFAPIVSAKQAGDIFGRATPFMTIADKVREPWRDALGAVVHVDGSTRAQVLPTGSALTTARILERFGEATGTPVLLNTSFNLNDEPMVAKPDHAIATFFRSGLDMLVFEHGVLVKR